jgi:AraC family transcriptional regulator of adaptative response/methylated-DNA-[protein]-cysteine methyltransferase
LAARLGMPRAARAVGAAVGRNPVAWLIPCHRVVRTGGGLGGYHWGVARKRAMLDWEARHNAARPESPRITSG